MPTLRDFLEKINISAKIAYDEPMAAHTSFHIGGPADAYVLPQDERSALVLVRAARAEGIPLFTLGGGANLLVGDRGIRGIVLDTAKLDSVAEEPEEDGSGAVILAAGAGLAVDRLCEEALSRALTGLENFAGLPGTVGGAVYMNARCYEFEAADRLAWVEAASPAPEAPVERRPIDRAEWAYKCSPYQDDGPARGSLILRAAFRLTRGDPAAIEAVMRARRADREAKGHYRLPSAGSVFKNDRALGRPSGKILDELGLRGHRMGGAMVSEWHANIFVNTGGATARDMLALIEFAQSEARTRLGIELEPEVIFAGDF